MSNLSSMATSWTMTLQAFAAQLQATHFAQNSIDAYMRDTHHFFRWVQKKDPVAVPAKLHNQHIEDYRQMLIGIGRQSTTINRRIGAISQFTAWAKAVGLTADNIGAEAERMHMQTRVAPVGLMKAETKALLQAAKASLRGHGPRNLALVQLLLQTGILPSEVALLRRCHLTFEKEKGHLYIEGTVQLAREIPLSQAFCRELHAYLATRSAPSPDTPLFTNERGQPLNKRGIQHIIQRLGMEANITRLSVSPRTLHDTFALSYLRKHPRHLVELARLLGHKTLNAVHLLQGSLT